MTSSVSVVTMIFAILPSEDIPIGLERSLYLGRSACLACRSADLVGIGSMLTLVGRLKSLGWEDGLAVGCGLSSLEKSDFRCGLLVNIAFAPFSRCMVKDVNNKQNIRPVEL